MDHPKLYDLVQADSTETVLKEVETIITLTSPEFDLAPVKKAFWTTIDLFQGKYPGYKACNTLYHDLRHTTDTFLAMARLIHGAMLEGENFSQSSVTIGLIAALFHDAGYIQKSSDQDGTGAKYMIGHVKRSADFLETYAAEQGFSADEVHAGRFMILCTDMAVDLLGLEFTDPEVGLLGKLLNGASLLAQMADRTYLEKCLLLYHEFQEGNIGDYQGEVDLLRNTLAFYEFVDERFGKLSNLFTRFLISHFLARWNLPRNLYREAIERQKNFLMKILKMADIDPRNHLKRYNMVRRAHESYKDERQVNPDDSHVM